MEYIHIRGVDRLSLVDPDATNPLLTPSLHTRKKKRTQDLWYDHEVANEEQILEAWEAMLKHVAWRWNLLGIDIKNEPHGCVNKRGYVGDFGRDAWVYLLG